MLLWSTLKLPETDRIGAHPILNDSEEMSRLELNAGFARWCSSVYKRFVFYKGDADTQFTPPPLPSPVDGEGLKFKMNGK